MSSTLVIWLACWCPCSLCCNSCGPLSTHRSFLKMSNHCGLKVQNQSVRIFTLILGFELNQLWASGKEGELNRGGYMQYIEHACVISRCIVIGMLSIHGRCFPSPTTLNWQNILWKKHQFSYQLWWVCVYEPSHFQMRISNINSSKASLGVIFSGEKIQEHSVL